MWHSFFFSFYLALINAVIDRPQQFVAVGGNAAFNCSSDATEGETVTWVKGDGSTFPSNVVQSGTVLTITSAVVGDGGAYNCTTSKGQTSATSVAVLTVICKLFILYKFYQICFIRSRLPNVIDNNRKTFSSTTYGYCRAF